MKKILLHWQEECIEKWKKNQFRGIVNVVTGAGKTVLAIGAVEELLNMADIRSLKVKIVVPKTFLLYQWHNSLMEDLDINRNDIGFFSGAHKTADSCGFMLYVINSARYSLARHIVDDIKNGERVFLIADECHHYGSEENSKIFSFSQNISTDTPFYTLGLSATPHSKNYQDVLIPALGEEIYRFTFFNALKADVIGKFTVFNVCVSFDKEETANYEDLSEKLGIALFKLKAQVPSLYHKNGHEFFSGLDYIIKNSDYEIAELAKAVLFLSVRRKEVAYLAKSRIECVIRLVELTRKTSRIIIFGERIETAEEIYRRLMQTWPNEVGIYHSKLPKIAGKNTLRQFENFEIRILVSCKTLDEGLNVSETDVGIVVSSTGSRRQRVQRLGRVLRKKRNDGTAYFYYLFVDNTAEEDELLKEMADRHMNDLINVIDLRFDEKTGIFSNALYLELVSSVVSELSGAGHDSKKIWELLRNADIGLLTGDWLMSENTCIEKIKSASEKAGKNYYIAMLLLIRARLAQHRHQASSIR